MDEKKMGERIAALRTEKNLTQQQLAEKLGVSDKTVSKWETGGGFPDITSVPALAEILGVSTDYLLGSNRKLQKIFVFENGEFKKIDNKNIPIPNVINKDYLDKGWQLKTCQASSYDDGTVIIVVLEKEVID